MPLVDLAVRLPKSSANFYDWVHFTADGASQIAGILEGELVSLLKQTADSTEAKRKE